jgi:hypothetical protein
VHNHTRSHRTNSQGQTFTSSFNRALIFTHRSINSRRGRVVPKKHLIRTTIFVVLCSISIIAQAMQPNSVDSASNTPTPKAPVSLNELLRAEREAVEPSLDSDLAYLAAINKDKRYLQRLLMSATQAGKDTKNSAIRVRIIIQLLLERGADPFEPDRFGATPFSQSCSISSYPIIKNIIDKLTRGTLDPNHQSNTSTTPLLWQMLELASKYHVYQLVKTALECDANPDILNATYESILDRLLPKKEWFIKAERHEEYTQLVRILYRFGATTNETDLRDYFNEQEAKELEGERSVYRADEAYLLDTYTQKTHPGLSQKPLKELYVLALQKRVPVQALVPTARLIADYSGNNSFATKRTPPL